MSVLYNNHKYDCKAFYHGGDEFLAGLFEGSGCIINHDSYSSSSNSFTFLCSFFVINYLKCCLTCSFSCSG